MFPLCRTCVELEEQLTPCAHSNDERALSGCWVTLELLKAVEKGYTVVNIDEVWHFPQTSDSLFSDYVKKFLQFKQESSGYPAHVTSEVEKQAYVDNYFEKEGIRLNPEKICVNPAGRTISKLLCITLWGRFSMRENLPHN